MGPDYKRSRAAGLLARDPHTPQAAQQWDKARGNSGQLTRAALTATTNHHSEIGLQSRGATPLNT
jgi:hypothetical protein